jgi:multidrug efflux pump subunit AcrB
MEPGERGEESGTRRSAVAREVREHPMAYGVLAVFLVAGPFVASLLFPEAPLGVTVFGGFLFGGVAALCALPGKFF